MPSLGWYDQTNSQTENVCDECLPGLFRTDQSKKVECFRVASIGVIIIWVAARKRERLRRELCDAEHFTHTLLLPDSTENPKECT